MPERVELWWQRRQWSKAAPIPYAVGTYRSDWERFPVLVRQFHPEFNGGITLTQVPPGADVWLLWQCDVGHRFIATPDEQRRRPGRSRRRSTWCPDCAAGAVGRPPRASRQRDVCGKTPPLGVGEPFHSECAPRPASAAEALLRQKLGARLHYTEGFNAVRVAHPFFEHLEIWPDILIPELRVAIEYDTTGRDGLDHVGQRETADRRKDRMLRAAGWEVIRIRCGKLQPLGQYDVRAGGVNRKLIDRLLERFREVRGDLIVNCYLR